jgi:hypothetical protein
MATTTQNDAPVGEARPGASWRDKEEHVLPKNRLDIVFFGLMCTVFLAALDQVSSHIALGQILNGGHDRRLLRLHSRRSWPSLEVETTIAGWAGTLCHARAVCRYLFSAGSY